MKSVIARPDPKGFFGEAIVDPSSTVTNNLRFPGQYFDAETGKHYNWNRYFDPKKGGYTQTDPIGFEADDVNLYRYVGNNVINWIDPLGLSNWRPVPGASGWEVRHDNYPEPHDHYRHRGQARARKVFPNGSQVKHGEGSDEDVPEEVIEARNKKNNKNENDKESRCEITPDANRGWWDNYGTQIVGGGLIVGGSALIIGDMILGGPTGEGIVPGLILIRRGGTAFGF